MTALKRDGLSVVICHLRHVDPKACALLVPQEKLRESWFFWELDLRAASQQGVLGTATHSCVCE